MAQAQPELHPPEPSELSQAIFMAYQVKWVEDQAPVKIMEKSRRIGLSYSEAADDVLYAASASGANVYYISYNKEMTQGFIQDCASWAKAFNAAAGQIEESVLLEEDKQILSYTINFDSGHKIQAFTSNPRNLRSKGRPGERLVIDEAAFVDDIKELLKAAMAMTMWGGQIRIISTHNGEDNPFNELINDVRAGRYPYSLHRVDFDDALRDGLYRKICAVNNTPWTPEGEATWREEIIARYRPNQDEELFCVPAQGGGTWLTRVLVESRMVEAPVIRFTGTKYFNQSSPAVRQVLMQEWIDTELKPLLKRLNPELRHALGMDFARTGDLSVIAPVEVASNLHEHVPFLVELKNVPYNQQLQVLFAICDVLPRVSGIVIDSRGNGSYIGEAAEDRYGSIVLKLMPTESWYRDNMPGYKAAFEDGTFTLPKHDGLLQDHRAFKLVRGVARIPEGKTDGDSHGDRAMACVYAHAAAKLQIAPIDYTEVPGHARGFDNRANPDRQDDDFHIPEHEGW
ncbi:terminase large subunit domain-containing protein [Comamonas thiooxydans]|uniref:terminase large subunit domain-containing protein n=1 Tax=Comamonas thiooxydans TaxID=363952 RepID=UPI00209BC118|nr:terminase family protein [Comamonas thiooxydans]MCO8248489.1 terminase family protein [Comamonas thiooxydans]